MTPHGLFSFCQKGQGRNPGSIASFEKSQNYAFYCSLLYYFKNVLKISSDNKIKKFISVCAQSTENNFNPFMLNSAEYLDIFKEWYKIHANVGTYYINIHKSFQQIYKFCVDRNVKTLDDYVKKWAVSHILSGALNENIAYALGVHKLTLTTPEILSIKKKFIKHVPLIGERIERDEKLKSVLDKGIEDVKNKLIWHAEHV